MEQYFESQVERAVIGSMLVGDEYLDIGMESLSMEDFRDKDCKRIFSAMTCLRQSGALIDSVTVGEMFESDYMSKILDIVGDSAYSVAHFSGYLSQLKAESKMRRFREGITKISKLAKDGDSSVYEKTHELLEDLEDDGSGNGEVKLIGDCIFSAIAEIGERKKGISTGYPALDRQIGGFVKSNLVVVAGRPSMGKSTLAENMALNVARRDGNVVVIFSLEMQNEEISRRLSMGYSKVSERDIAIRDQRAVSRLMDGAQAIQPLKIFCYDKGSLTAQKMYNTCKRIKKKENRLDVVIVDYIGLMKTTIQRKNSSRQQEIGEISHAMKQMAMELDCTVIMVAQLNRGPEMRSNHEPIMADLRESGDIEQDADVILFPYRPYVYDETENPRDAQIIIAKNRNGPTGKIDLHWFGEWFLFANPVREGEDEE